MKKLLFVTALLAMGTMAMGSNLVPNDDNTSAEVEVRANVIDDKFSITDIYGQPLVLNFKEVMQGDKNVKASVRYKVSMKDGDKFEGTMAKFKMEILGDTTDTGAISKNVVISNTDSTKTTNNKMTVGLGLDNETKYLGANGTEFQGEVFGNIAEVHAQQATGDYVGYATLTATVQEVK